MKKNISRMLALLMTLILLVSGMSAALASVAVELGNMAQVEQMLFDAVVDVFPTSTLEQQFVYYTYYEENGTQANLDALMATLTGEQAIAFTNYRIEHSDCMDGCGGEACAVEACECLCHAVARFTENMGKLIELLEELDMNAVIQYIAALRMEELIAYWGSFGPIPTAGTEAYERYIEEYSAETGNEKITSFEIVDVIERGAGTYAEELEGENSTEAEQLANNYNNLVNNADPEALEANSDTKAVVDNVIQTNLDAEDTLNDLYGDNVDSSTYLSSTGEDQALNQLNQVGALMTMSVDELSDTYASTRAAGDVISLTPVTASEIIHDNNISIKLFNYDSTINNDSVFSNYKFTQSSTYHGRTVNGYKGSPAVDGEGPSSTVIVPAMNKVTDAKGYPSSSNVTNLAKLFDGSVGKTYTIQGDGGLFWKDGNYYVYDSAIRSAILNSSKTGFNLYEEVGRPWYTINNDVTDLTDVQKGNFLPFNSEAKQDNYFTGGDTYIVDPPDLWFGMSVQFDFYMPKGGKYGDEAMVFNFLGDDDVWVYIDDVLVQDIGGTHGAYSSSIDFSTGAITHSNPTDAIPAGSTLKGLFTAAGKDTSKFNADNNTFKDFSKHTLRFYYLERGGNISYCKLKFNIPTLPSGQMSIQKDAIENVTPTTDQQFTMRLDKVTGNTLTVVPNASYKVSKNGVETGTGATNDKGEFLLSQGETVTFTSLASDITYRITETGAGDYTGETHWYLGDKLQETDYVEAHVDPEKAVSSILRAENVLKTTSLTVDKNVVNPRPADANNVYTFKGQILYGETYTTVLNPVKDSTGKTYDVDEKGFFTFTLTADQTITFVDLPIGAKVIIEEVNTAASEGVKAVNVADFALTAEATNFAVDESSGTGENSYTFAGVMSGIEGSTVTFTNTPKIYDLTITKKGLKNGENGAENLDPCSSTMYHVTGNGVDMIVAIYGNNSVTIRDLPVGNYTVTEITNWSWRYRSASNRENNQVQLDGDEDNITFTNTRDEFYWLDSDCYAENLFASDTIASKQTINPTK